MGLNKRLGCFGRKLLLRWAVGGVVTEVGESLQATSLVSLNPLETTPWLSESEKYSLHKKRNRINRIREIHGGWWCGRKVACYQLSGCCGRSSQASTSIWTPHLAFPFPHHHTAALSQTRFLQTIFFQTVFLHHTLPFLFYTTTLLLCHTVNQHKTNPTHYLLNFACILLILLNYLLYHLKDKNIILAI